MQPTNTAYIFFNSPYSIMFHCRPIENKSGTKKEIQRKVYNYKNVDWIKLGVLLSVKCSID